ncbi:MAG TPA: zf-HC2 domain-containing protein [Terriglobales bacterium]|nr:zf-HC2 domain-containing protein [Terriglobales bacterium]
MTGLPKFVRDQMARTPAPASHPDADVLTAFAEDTLTAKERQGVIQHLSECVDCREIVFLAQPEAAETQTVFAPKSRRFTWMAWGSLAAVIVVVASAVILQHEQVTEIQAPVTVATTTAPAPPEVKPIPPSTTSAAKVPVSAARTRAEVAREETKLDAAKGKLTTEPLLTNKDVSANEERAFMKAPAPAAVQHAVKSEQVIVGGVAPQQVPAGPEQRDIPGQTQQAQRPSNTVDNVNIAASNQGLAKVESAPAAKVAKKQPAGDFNGIVTGYTAAPAAAPVAATRPRWQISSTGTLEHSYMADNWTPVLSDTGAKFRVVSVVENTVWAGGEHGALYVSRDGGTTWTPVPIDTTATITSIRFSDNLHGTLETDGGQAWNTTDGGKVWQKR